MPSLLRVFAAMPARLLAVPLPSPTAARAVASGSVTTGIVVLDSAVFLLGVVLLGGLLVWITKRIIIDERF